jgi:hypothetical protein
VTADFLSISPIQKILESGHGYYIMWGIQVHKKEGMAIALPLDKAMSHIIPVHNL